MRYRSIITLTLMLTMFLTAQQPKPAPKKPAVKKSSSVLKTDEEKMSYLSGYDIGLKIAANVKASGFPLRTSAYSAGMLDALDGIENRLTPEEIQQCVELFQKMNPQADNQKKLDEMLAKYKKEGADFLAANAKKDSVMTTPSGLQYKVLRNGNGRSPADTNTVTVHYRGRLINGTVFDESYGRGEPTTFRLDQVIKGWTEGLQLMKEGSKFEFYIPNNLAYGDQPAGQLIPPGSALIFEVELLSFK